MFHIPRFWFQSFLQWELCLRSGWFRQKTTWTGQEKFSDNFSFVPQRWHKTEIRPPVKNTHLDFPPVSLLHHDACCTGCKAPHRRSLTCDTGLEITDSTNSFCVPQSVRSFVSLAPNTAHISPRLVQLALPRLKESNICRELGRPEESIWTVRATRMSFHDLLFH